MLMEAAFQYAEYRDQQLNELARYPLAQRQSFAQRMLQAPGIGFFSDKSASPRFATEIYEKMILAGQFRVYVPQTPRIKLIFQFDNMAFHDHQFFLEESNEEAVAHVNSVDSPFSREIFRRWENELSRQLEYRAAGEQRMAWRNFPKEEIQNFVRIALEEEKKHRESSAAAGTEQIPLTVIDWEACTEQIEDGECTVEIIPGTGAIWVVFNSVWGRSGKRIYIQERIEEALLLPQNQTAFTRAVFEKRDEIKIPAAVSTLTVASVGKVSSTLLCLKEKDKI